MGQLTFDDAVKIAIGCTDYGGGYRGNAEHYAIYQHGIETVISALTCAADKGISNYQVRMLHAIGESSKSNQTDQQHG